MGARCPSEARPGDGSCQKPEGHPVGEHACLTEAVTAGHAQFSGGVLLFVQGGSEAEPVTTHAEVPPTLGSCWDKASPGGQSCPLNPQPRARLGLTPSPLPTRSPWGGAWARGTGPTSFASSEEPRSLSAHSPVAAERPAEPVEQSCLVAAKPQVCPVTGPDTALQVALEENWLRLGTQGSAS